MEKKKKSDESRPPLMALNHVSRLGRDVKKSLEFCIKVLVKDDDKLPSNTDHLEPMDNHMSFQCEDMRALEKRLKEVNVKSIKRTVGDQEDAAIDQLFLFVIARISSLNRVTQLMLYISPVIATIRPCGSILNTSY
ncbi:hypothetical protein Bca4012_082445 [Brassica carinata]|uniref:Uncharacterized protein n=1 Tax=Brassica carinata TaxID=52824 RepID=A0A8X7VC51_BRACI|nr:hypothetical protein Bca52824_028212 [Brassica carinata]